MKVRIPKDFGGGNQQQMMQKIQKMQEDMALKQEELEAKEYEISSGGGAVKVTITGKKEIKNITISPDAVDADDLEMLSDLLCAAVNEAIRKVEDTSTEEMGKISNGINIPGF